jgi:hypothetical protein
MRAWICLLAACSSTPATLTGKGWRETGEDALFHQDPRWLGADAAYTIDLGDDRTLWLFGDTFIATSPADVRTMSTMVHDSVAVMTGRDPATATMQFAWTDTSPPDAFFPEAGAHWFWPADGARVPNGPLVVLLSEIEATPGQGLGFAGVGYRAIAIADPSGPPSGWQLAPVPTSPAPYDATAAVACSVVDGDYLVALIANTDAHHERLARWPLAQIVTDLSAPEWWDGTSWRADATAPPALFDGATECSLQRLDGRWVYVDSEGFGASTIAIRTASALTGPWSNPTTVFTPPEDAEPNPFVYAGKGHPMLTTHEPGANLVVTYADNSFTFSDLFDPSRAATLYWPHVAELALH